jgi:hypothetical protein
MASFTRDWDEANPTDSTYANEIDEYNRYLRVDVSDRIKDMVYGFTAGQNDGVQSFQKLTMRQQASAPSTPAADFIELYALDDGSNCGLYAKEENGYTKQILKVSGSALVLNVGDADGVVATSGNQTIAGNKTLSGTTTLAAAVLNGALSGTYFKDEDTMSSNAANAVASQQSIKAYIDSVLATHAALTDHVHAYAYVSAAGALVAGFNVASAAKDDDGDYTVTWDTDFANANYAAVVTINDSNASTQRVHVYTDNKAAGSIQVHFRDFNTADEDLAFSIIAFGTSA